MCHPQQETCVTFLVAFLQAVRIYVYVSGCVYVHVDVCNQLGPSVGLTPKTAHMAWHYQKGISAYLNNGQCTYTSCPSLYTAGEYVRMTGSQNDA